MYLIDFFQRTARKANIPVFVYLLLNIFIIGIVTSSVIDVPTWQGMLLGIALYIVSLAVALSPFGEMILRFQTGCKKICREDQRAFLEPIFQEVYTQAKRMDPSISDNIQLYINDETEPNAFATGRKTICVTKGLLNMPVDQIKATLAHEFGHLSHKDTDLVLVVSVGNLIVSAIILGIRLAIEIFHFILGIVMIFVGGWEGVVGLAVNAIYRMILTFVIAGLTWLWTKIGILLVMKSSRSNEYEADAFAFQMGYGKELGQLLDSIEDYQGTKGLFANLASSHPDTNERIARLQNMGNGYQAVYDVPAQSTYQPQQIQAVTQEAAPTQPICRMSQTEKTPQESFLGKMQLYIYCTHCGGQMDADANFCTKCGARVLH
ncbi:MAG: M48 family metalloprotease [Eubacteriales bacterium]|nr:M48 family metalloprotease [Eubacteriales bacterium]